MDNENVHFEALIDKTYYEFKDSIESICNQLGIFSREINHKLLMELRGHAVKEKLSTAVNILDSLIEVNKRTNLE